MKNLLKKYSEQTKRKIDRLFEKNLIKYDLEKNQFLYKETEKPVEGIKLKRKYREDFEEYAEIDFSDDSKSYQEN